MSSMLSSVTEMFILNDTAKNDSAVQIALREYAQRLQDEEDYRQKVLSGEVIPQRTTVYNISDRD